MKDADYFVGQIIKRIRKDLGLSMAKLGIEAGLSGTTISALESGSRISIKSLHKVSTPLGKDKSYFHKLYRFHLAVYRAVPLLNEGDVDGIVGTLRSLESKKTKT